MHQINVSIVLYHNEVQVVKKTINSILDSTINVVLYLIDNSANDSLKNLKDNDPRINYVFNNANLGYGAAHNIAIKKSIEDNIPYHLVLNPDVYFDNQVLVRLFDYMQSNKDVGNVMPLVRYPNKQIQYLCKLLPTPIDLIFRRFIPSESLKEKINFRYELRESGYNSSMNVPNLSGCFMFLRTAAVKEVGLFDENIFMYLEDIDLNRRINSKYKTIFYPEVEVFHNFAKESYTNKTLLKHHIKSAIYYFNKWGWMFDSTRKTTNRNTLNNIQKIKENKK